MSAVVWIDVGTKKDMRRDPVPKPIKSPDEAIPTGSDALFCGNHRSICGARATRIQARPIPAMTLLSKSFGKLSRRKGRKPNPTIIKNAPIDIDDFGPFLSTSEPAGQAKKITNTPMRDINKCDCQPWIPNRASKNANMGDTANQFAPNANITSQNAPTIAQRYP